MRRLWIGAFESAERVNQAGGECRAIRSRPDAEDVNLQRLADVEALEDRESSADEGNELLVEDQKLFELELLGTERNAFGERASQSAAIV